MIYKNTSKKVLSIGDEVLMDHITGKDKSPLDIENASKTAGCVALYQ